jgi:anti-sigma-K factor RskA
MGAMMADLTQDDIALAGEYALGLLDTAGTASAAARAATDAAFGAEVEAWRERLLPVLDGAEEAAPDYIWPAIEAKLRNPVTQDNIKRIRFWQLTSFASAGVAAVLAALLVLKPAPAPQIPNAPLIAALGSETGKASLTARYDSTSGDMLLTPVSLDTGKLYPELWIIPSDGKARSLGIVAGDHATQIIVPAEMRQFMEKGATLAITPEPIGGAPGGKATGPVIASGKIIPV